MSYGEFTKSGEWMMRDVLEKVWGDVNEKYGTDIKPEDHHEGM